MMTPNDEATTSHPNQAPGTPRSSDPSAGADGGPRVSADEMRDLRRLRRTTRDKYVAGVAGGLARHFDVDPLVPRVALAVLVLFGGSGLLLYGALWMLLPRDDTGRSVVALDDRSRSVAIAIAGGIAALALLGDLVNGWVPWPLLVILLVIALVVGSHQRRQGPPPPPMGAPGPGGDFGYPAGGYPAGPSRPSRTSNPRRRGPILFWFTAALGALAIGLLALADVAGIHVADSAYPALGLSVVGLMLVVGAFVGRAGGLILVGFALTLATMGAMASEHLDSERHVAEPTTASAVADSYDYRLGETRIDLSGVKNAEDLAGRSIDIDLGMGRLELVLPDGVAVDVSAEVGLGEITFPERTSDGGGIQLDGSYGTSSGTDPDDVLTVHLEVGLGEVVVTQP